jgi:hypothetical protein
MVLEAVDNSAYFCQEASQKFVYAKLNPNGFHALVIPYNALFSNKDCCKAEKFQIENKYIA